VTGPTPCNQPSAAGGGRLKVGDRQGGGQLSASMQDNQRGRRVCVNAAEMTGVVVDVSVEEARAFALGLLELTDPDVLG